MKPFRYIRGRYMLLSLPRRYVCDLIHFAKRVPTVATQRRMRLCKVIAARSEWPVHCSWYAIFIKAYALVCAARPELRRTYQPFPWAHLYEHPVSIATVAIERDYKGEPGVFIGHLYDPSVDSLVELDAAIRHFQNSPIEKIGEFVWQLRMSRLPRFLRRLIWRAGIDIAGPSRHYFVGTFSLSVVARYGASSLQQLTPMTTSLNYSPFEPDGSCDVRITYDHRVFDGATTARALVELEEALNGPVLEELRSCHKT